MGDTPDAAVPDVPAAGYSDVRGPDGHFIPLVQGVVEATAILVSNGSMSPGEWDRSKIIERRVVAAIEAMDAEGITDVEERRARILRARDAVLAEESEFWAAQHALEAEARK